MQCQIQLQSQAGITIDGAAAVSAVTVLRPISFKIAKPVQGRKGTTAEAKIVDPVKAGREGASRAMRMDPGAEAGNQIVGRARGRRDAAAGAEAIIYVVATAVDAVEAANEAPGAGAAEAIVAGAVVVAGAVAVAARGRGKEKADVASIS